MRRAGGVHRAQHERLGARQGIASDHSARSVQRNAAWERTWARRRWDGSTTAGPTLLVIGVFLKLVVVGVIQDLELLFDGERLRPHTAQLQRNFCCSFIFLRTVSFST